MPLFLFLASSLNVELVYTILKGVTSFSYLGEVLRSREPTEPLDEKIKAKADKIHYEKNEKGDVVIRYDKIKIKDIDKWSKIKDDKDMHSAQKQEQLDGDES